MRHLSRQVTYFIASILVYISLAAFLPANKVAQSLYHLSSTQYHVMVVLILLPYVAIWLAAYYGYRQLAHYSRAIHKAPEGREYEKLTAGLRLLTWGLPISAILSIILNGVANAHPGFLGASNIINTFVALLIPLAAFSIIGAGSRGLADRDRLRLSKTAARSMMAVFIVLGVLFCFVVFRQVDLIHLTSTDNPYYLPTWLLIISVVMPYLYTWFVGLLSVWEMLLLSRKVPGVLYRQATKLLAAGFAAIIASSIFIQYLHTAVARTGHLSLNVVLLVINIVYIFMGGGYILLSLGARRLRKIEEV